MVPSPTVCGEKNTAVTSTREAMLPFYPSGLPYVGHVCSAQQSGQDRHRRVLCFVANKQGRRGLGIWSPRDFAIVCEGLA